MRYFIRILSGQHSGEAVSLTQRGFLVRTLWLAGACLQGVCMFSCLHGFSPASPTPSHSSQTCLLG